MRKKVTLIEQYVINIVREKREKLGLTQSDLAEILDVSPGFIGKIESSRYTSKYNLNHINKLSKHFNCSPRIFLPQKAFRNDRSKKD